MSHERCVAILRRLLLRRIFETQRPGRSYAVGVGLDVSNVVCFETEFSLADRRQAIASACARYPSKSAASAFSRKRAKNCW
jgi:hypothetical protein